ncbi:hypothetical protein T08_12214 [Trichinella sp. T8]|nr:hypothetical protein T08_12214 [Trichinella sp. T8]
MLRKMVRCGLEYRINKDGSRPGEDSYLVKLRVSSLTNDIKIFLEFRPESQSNKLSVYENLQVLI